MYKSSLIPILLAFILSLVWSEPIHIKLHRKKEMTDSHYLKVLPDVERPVYTNISLSNFLNDQYIGTVYLGANKQPFNLLFDTGSAWLWVGEKSAGLSNHYECSSSHSCDKRDHTYQLMYGQGQGYGHLTYDQIHFGENLTANAQPFLLVPAIQNMGTLMGDGILGLGFKSLSENHATFLDTLQEQGVIENKVFSMYLGSDPTSTGDETGDFILGGYDPYYMTSEFTHFDVTDDNYWAINFQGVKLGNQSLSLPKGAKAIIDSGTSLMSFPSSTVKDISSYLSSMGIFCNVVAGLPIFCDCPNSFDDFPNITLTFDQEWSATLTGRDYVTNVAGECMLGFQLVDYMNYVILGDIFMRKYYTLFDADNMRIGFADAIPYTPNHFWRTFILVTALLICVALVLMVLKHFREVMKMKKSYNNNLLRSDAIGGNGLII